MMDFLTDIIIKYHLFDIFMCIAFIFFISSLISLMKNNNFELSRIFLKFPFVNLSFDKKPSIDNNNAIKKKNKINKESFNNKNTILSNKDKKDENKTQDDKIYKKLFNDENPKNYFIIGKEFFEQKNYSEAINQFTNAINNNGKNIAAYYFRGISLFNQYIILQKKTRELDSAISDFNKVILFNKNHMEAHYYLAKCYSCKWEKTYNQTEKNEYKRLALHEFNKVKSYNKDQYPAFESDFGFDSHEDLKSSAYFYEGYLHFKCYLKESNNASILTMFTEDLQTAIEDFSKVIMHNNNNFNAYLYRGHLYYFCARAIDFQGMNNDVKEKKYNENLLRAENDYTEAIRLNPYLEELYLFRGLDEDIIKFIKMVPDKKDYFNICKKLNKIFYIIDSKTDAAVKNEYERIESNKNRLGNMIKEKYEKENQLKNKDIKKLSDSQVNKIKESIAKLKKEIFIMNEEEEMRNNEIEKMMMEKEKFKNKK